MYRIILINKNPEQIQHLKKSIEKSELPFSVTATFSSSKRAKNTLENTRPNLVIADFEDVRHSDSEFVAYIQKNHPSIHIILYTDSTDFNLTKAALNNGVFAYVGTKNEDELLAALFRAKESLDRHKTQANRNKLLTQLVMSAKKQLLADIFTGNLTDHNEIQKMVKSLSAEDHARGSVYIPFWIRFPNYDEYMKTRWNYDNERFLIAIGNFLRPNSEDFEIQNIMYTNGEILYVALCNTGDSGSFINALRVHLANAQYHLRTMIGLTVNWHLGKHFTSFKSLVEHITSPILKNTIHNDLDAKNQATLLNVYKNAVVSAMLDKSPRLKEHLAYIVQKLSQASNDASPKILLLFCENFMQNLAPKLEKDTKYKRMVQSLKKASGASARTICTNILYTICRNAETDTEATNPISQAEEYIKKNFTKDLTLEEVAKYLNLNASYFSRIFKQKIGKSFRDYVIALRIEKAQELLSVGTYKVYEVCSMCGYKNSKYFASQFKAVTNMTPKEFSKNRHRITKKQ